MQWDSYGFEVSKTSGEYKLVRIFQDSDHVSSNEWRLDTKSWYFQVYTLGKGSWRSINAPCTSSLMYEEIGFFF